MTVFTTVIVVTAGLLVEAVQAGDVIHETTPAGGPGAARGLHCARPSLATPQAGTAAARTTGFSTIGRLMTAESKPNRTESHHTAS